jgi:hypothetical protein
MTNIEPSEGIRVESGGDRVTALLPLAGPCGTYARDSASASSVPLHFVRSALA